MKNYVFERIQNNKYLLFETKNCLHIKKEKQNVFQLIIERNQYHTQVIFISIQNNSYCLDTKNINIQ